MKNYFLFIFLTVATASANAKFIISDYVDFEGAQLASFLELDSNRHLKSLGVLIPKNSLKNLPSHETKIILNLPNSPNLKPFKFIEVNWNPHGHEPPGIYHSPHFDFHFYTISHAAVAKISCQGTDEAVCLKMPAPTHIAPNFAPTPAGVPQMGWHWIDTLAPEFNGGAFSKTFLYGYYNGKINFLEPMVTLDFLQSKVHEVLPIRQPAHFSQAGYYPKNYEIGFNAKKEFHYVRLINFR